MTSLSPLISHTYWSTDTHDNPPKSLCPLSMTDCDCESIYSEKTSLDCCKGHSSFNVQYHVCIMMPITITSTATSSVVRRPRIQTLVITFIDIWLLLCRCRQWMANPNNLAQAAEFNCASHTEWIQDKLLEILLSRFPVELPDIVILWILLSHAKYMP